MDIDFFTDGLAWGIGIVVWLLFMVMIWKFGTMFGSNWDMFSKVIVSVVGLPVCYAMAKLRMDK